MWCFLMLNIIRYYEQRCFNVNTLKHNLLNISYANVPGYAKSPCMLIVFLQYICFDMVHNMKHRSYEQISKSNILHCLKITKSISYAIGRVLGSVSDLFISSA